TLTDGFRIKSAAQIISVVPDSANQGESLTVSITGQNTIFAQGSDVTNSVWFAQGSNTINATSVTVHNATSLSADFEIPLSAETGWWDVSVFQVGDQGIVTLTDGFRIKSAAQIISVVPDSANQGESLTVSITGQNTTFAQGSDVTNSVWFSQGSSTINAASVTVHNATSLSADFEIPLSAETGWWDVSVFQVGGQGIVTLDNGFKITPSAEPVIVSVVPDSAYQGESLNVTITGENTHFEQGSETVNIVWFSQGSSTIEATSVNVTSKTQLDAHFEIAEDAPLGLWDVSVKQGEGFDVVTLQNGFEIKLVSGINQNSSARNIPASFELAQNFPNPFNATTKIKFGLPEASNVKFYIYDILGNLVKEVAQNYDRGYYSITWDGTDARGLAVATGIYIYRLETSCGTSFKKMLMLK
ncbi:T9SS type A sorting domain-containing protein, partial [candidate division KSB1 bacterium]|nr:T9SS type A sorting domain-containing protein [candidate division KSB1 bacterium]